MTPAQGNATATARVVVLISGRGRNFEAIFKKSQLPDAAFQIAAVISNRPNAKGLVFAAEQGIPNQVVDHTAFADRSAFEAELQNAIDAYAPDIVVLAGFMRRLGAEFVRHFHGRMINIHPSLLPKYRGLHTHRRALEDGETEHGASVHFVSEELDGGPVIAQGAIQIEQNDDEDSLAQRILESVELTLYPQCVQLLAEGRIQWSNNALQFDGQILDQPLRF